MDVDTVRDEWQRNGFVVLPGYLPASDLAPALGELESMFPSPDGFHDGTDPRRERYLRDEFDGIDELPFASVELSLLAVSDRLVSLARELLSTDDLRIYSAEAWAKFTGAVDYDQPLHRDYLAHTLLVPTDAPAYRQLEMFVYLVDVPEGFGPPHLLSRQHTGDLPARPNWYPRTDVGEKYGDFVAPTGSPHLYEAEVSGAGPAGTVVAFQPGTFHRGTGMTTPRGARYTMHLNYRPAAAEWGNRHAWANRSHEPAWYRFVSRATPHQLALFGFPLPGHPYWTAETVAGVSERYPHLDMSPWQVRGVSGDTVGRDG
ncbi:phytanoyl-CoA dioxygenase family protein [Micromonospora sp. WMMD998]|uniref:phytanoyl-CoA dioxygenase family protein n=1 Tax=Micromonospora sp. WMMD998 TaxID=3016092 RepID=UPI00249BC883|nr:phytanoyl-CoA dioxygenase family protein [Micromonospora sp. WMMD998]WFE41989.1 phytanoyl-CoA dioxygenase family protein [Micromonospora sp. WMMD998]